MVSWRVAADILNSDSEQDYNPSTVSKPAQHSQPSPVPDGDDTQDETINSELNDASFCLSSKNDMTDEQ